MQVPKTCALPLGHAPMLVELSLLFHHFLEILPTRQRFCQLHAETSVQRRSGPDRIGNAFEIDQKSSNRCLTTRPDRRRDSIKFFFDFRQLRISSEDRSFEVISPDSPAHSEAVSARKPSMLLDLSGTVNHEYASAVEMHHARIDQNHPVIRCVIKLVNFITAAVPGGPSAEREKRHVGTEIAQDFRNFARTEAPV